MSDNGTGVRAMLQSLGCRECGGTGVVYEHHDGGSHPIHCPLGCDMPPKGDGRSGLHKRSTTHVLVGMPEGPLPMCDECEAAYPCPESQAVATALEKVAQEIDRHACDGSANSCDDVKAGGTCAYAHAAQIVRQFTNEGDPA